MTDPQRIKRPRDPNELAKLVVDIATGQAEGESPSDSSKNPHAVALGQRGGAKGGKARAERLTAEERRKIAKKAVEARWRRAKE